MAIFLNLLRNPWAIGALSVLLVGGIQQARVWRLSHNLASVEASLADQRAEWQRAVAEGQEAARKAVEAARDAERAAAEERLAQQQAAAERLREAARVAQGEANEWRQRYREALTADTECAAWSREKVQCPVE